MHKVGLQRLEQVEWAILEADGRIALIPATGLSADDDRRSRDRDAVLTSGASATGHR